MDGPRERLYMGLIYIVMCFRRGWCGWRFNHDGLGAEWGCHGVIAGLPRPKLVSSSAYDI